MFSFDVCDVSSSSSDFVHSIDQDSSNAMISKLEDIFQDRVMYIANHSNDVIDRRKKKQRVLIFMHVTIVSLQIIFSEFIEFATVAIIRLIALEMFRAIRVNFFDCVLFDNVFTRNNFLVDNVIIFDNDVFVDNIFIRNNVLVDDNVLVDCYVFVDRNVFIDNNVFVDNNILIVDNDV
jgi:UDP-3-O-[3-hydroxymyristoyl] glucosamine N-acyltransferase